MPNAQSVKDRLKNLAKKEGKAFDLLLNRYMQERFLYRLSISKHESKFYLKGGAFIYALSGVQSRPTRDIDFLGKHLSNDAGIRRNYYNTLSR